jgi:hypothetical protein
MQAGVRRRRYVTVGAALAGASVVVVAPIAPVTPWSPKIPVISQAMRLVAEDSLLNVPLNLFYDLVSIPYNEVQGVDTAASSLMFGDNFFVGGAANLFGIDPGDPTHVDAVVSTLLPFPALDQGFGGLVFEATGFLAAELPISASCATTTCYPVVPTDPVTGITDIDRGDGLSEQVLMTIPQGLFDHFFKVPLTGPDSLSTGFTFDPTQSLPAGVNTGYEGTDALFEPPEEGPVYPGLGFSNDPAVNGGNYFLGGTVIPNATDPSAPGTAPAEVTPADYANATELAWAGHTFTLDLAQPFQNFLTSLEAAPPTDGIPGADGLAIPGTGIELPTPTDVVQALQALAASLVVAFNPFQPGSPFCLGPCDLPGTSTEAPTLGITLPIVQDINGLTPGGNPIIDEYLTAVQNGVANIPNTADVDYTRALLQDGIFTFSPQQTAQIIANLSSINPALANLAVNAGLITDPGYLPTDPTALLPLGDLPQPVLGGLNPGLVPTDILQILGLGNLASGLTAVDSSDAVADSGPSFLAELINPFGIDMALLNVATLGIM